ncbi:uncharacterized protein LOC112568274 isoform X1 [Pomacea canaliculata]|uniref:uncharacterized protein LOC112568274 isoform X1 n=1 Tax=Pomacea canaliculata TaxID=400727 RepID=UPI000D73CD0D|nr:uncharacterized protein LOC112568274 isoform X1 [Pomacea canaliculata]
MTTTHQLMAAAFYLCGLLFLYHVDSVNSLRCKYCLPADCSSGNVTDIECLPNQICGIFRQFTPGVNSFQCKICDATDPHCGSGEVPDKDCTNDTHCNILRMHHKNPTKVDTYRGCSDGGEDYCEDLLDGMRLCYIFCNTSGCNNEPTMY